MVNPGHLFTAFNQCGVEFYSGVPDSLLKSICAYIADHSDPAQHLIAANEGSAVALAIGHHLATGKVPLVYLQNSGLGHAINPLLSLADPEVYSIPLLLMIGWRGEPGVADEPQHVKQGRVTPGLLDQLEIPYEIITAATDDQQAAQRTAELVARAKTENRPCALLVSKGTFAPYQLSEKETRGSQLSREEAIQITLASLAPDDLVVATTGFTSREVFEWRAATNQSHQRDFLTVGGMGHASQIALGIALSKPSRQVFCLDGDGAFFMHMGGSATCAAAGSSNFKHIVLNNGVHDSVGGQPTTGNPDAIENIARALGYRWTDSVQTPEAISAAMINLAQQPGPALLEIKVAAGARSDLGRPTVSPATNKTAFMEFLQS